MGDESSMFHDPLDDLSDPAIDQLIERYLGNVAVAQLNTAIATLVRTNAALQQKFLGKQVTTQSAPITAPDQLVVRLHALDTWLQHTETANGRKSLDDAVGNAEADKAREAAKEVVAVNQQLQKRILADGALHRVIQGFHSFDMFAAYVGNKEGLAALERALGPEAAKRARDAAIELIGISGRLHSLERPSGKH